MYFYLYGIVIIIIIIIIIIAIIGFLIFYCDLLLRNSWIL